MVRQKRLSPFPSPTRLKHINKLALVFSKGVRFRNKETEKGLLNKAHLESYLSPFPYPPIFDIPICYYYKKEGKEMGQERGKDFKQNRCGPRRYKLNASYPYIEEVEKEDEWQEE